jgi:kynurenine 3-monooxygenase
MNHLPDLVADFSENPTGMLGTVRCDRWHDAGRAVLLGDAAHAVVPFHGQGMQCAFEDCLEMDRLVERHGADWEAVFSAFDEQRRDNANAIADMALENYIEMRDTVRDPRFHLRKELGFLLEERHPQKFIPRYSMVMFHAEIPYAEAKRRGALQLEILERLTRDAETVEQVDLELADRLVHEQL